MTATVTHETPDGFSVVSNTATAEQMAETFKDPKAPTVPAPAPEPESDQDEPAAAAPDGEQPPAPAEKPLGKPKNDPRARVMQATRQAAEAKRERDEIERRAIAAEAELERLRAGKPAAEPQKVETKPPDGRPKADDFESYDEFVEALTDWKAEQRESKSRQSREREQMVQAQAAMFQTFQQRVQAAIEADPTIDEHISPDVVALIPPGPVDLTKKLTNDQLLGVHFIAEERGVDMMKYLSENPDVLQRLRGLNQGSLLIELGRIDARLGSASTAPEPKPTISRAKPPVRPVTAVAPSGDDGDPDPEADFDTWAKQRLRQEAKERKAQRY